MLHATPNPMTAKRITTIILESLTHAGGCTLDFDTGEQPDTGFIVSVPGAELRVSKYPTAELVELWFINYAVPVAMLVEVDGGKPYVRAWWDETAGKTYLDVSIRVGDKDSALALARKWDQKTVYDIASKREVWIGVLIPAHAEPAHAEPAHAA